MATKTLTTSETLSPSSASPPWLDLPQPLSEHILERLSLADYIRFAAVCSRWRSIQSDHRLRHLPHPPPLVPFPLLTVSKSHSPSRDSSSRDPLPCFSPFEQRFYRLHPFPSPASTCLASQSSWLLIHEINCVSPSLAFFSLFNPLSSSLIQLPSLPTFTNNDPNLLFTGAMSSTPSNRHCAVMIVLHNDFYLFRLGGFAWTRLLFPGPAVSVITCNEKFYCNNLGVLVRVDPKFAKPVVERLEMDVSRIPENAVLNHLVEWNGEVVLVVVLFEGQGVGKRMTGAQVFAADLVSKVWVKLESLGDHIVVVGHNSSASMLGEDVGVGRGDFVYFTNPLAGVHWCSPERWSPWVVLDLRTGKMMDGTFPEKIAKSDKAAFMKKGLRWIMLREA